MLLGDPSRDYMFEQMMEMASDREIYEWIQEERGLGDAAEDAERKAHMEHEEGSGMADDDVIDVEGHEIQEAPLPVVADPGQSTALVARDEITITELVQQSQVIEDAMRRAMKEGIHYGRIPGVQKPTLLKPGAEKLLVLFRLAPSYDTDVKYDTDEGPRHMTVMAKCTLRHIPTQLVVAEGEGMCTTRESRYAYRKGERVCPECGKPEVREGKPRDGKPGNWYCWKKQGGCGATWDLDSEQGKKFKEMSTDRIPNPDLADQYNTVLKMGDKRALLAAILNGTAASDVFTQDMEDSPRGQSTNVDSDPYTGAEAQAPAVFDPAQHLRPDAPKGSLKKVYDLFVDIDGSVPWAELIKQAVQHVYGGDGNPTKLEEPMRTEAARRIANSAGRLSELFAGETFLSEESIHKAFAEMFDGVVVDVPPADKADK